MLWFIIWTIAVIAIIGHVATDVMHIFFKPFILLFFIICASVVVLMPFGISLECFDYNLPDKPIITKVTPSMTESSTRISYYDDKDSLVYVGSNVKVIKDTSNFIITVVNRTEKDWLYYIFGYVPMFNENTEDTYEIHTTMNIKKDEE